MPATCLKASTTLGLLAALGLLAGCAASSPPPAPMAAPAPAAAPGAAAAAPSDGAYRGTPSPGTSLGGGKMSCISPPPFVIRLKGGEATSSWSGPLHGTVGPDGSASLGPNGAGVTVTGTFSGDTFSGKIVSRNCSFPVIATKSMQ